jgi:hypothetical protein
MSLPGASNVADGSLWRSLPFVPWRRRLDVDARIVQAIHAARSAGGLLDRFDAQCAHL